MQLSDHVVISKRSYDSLTDQGERASVGRPVAAVRLQDTIVIHQTLGEAKTTHV